MARLSRTASPLGPTPRRVADACKDGGHLSPVLRPETRVGLRTTTKPVEQTGNERGPGIDEPCQNSLDRGTDAVEREASDTHVPIERRHDPRWGERTERA
jgi:hypothetical protein